MRTQVRLAAFAAMALALGSVACKKSRARALDDTTPSTAEKSPSTAGIADDKIKLAMTSVFTGANAGWGTEYYRGSMAYFLEVNSKGGVHGRQIVIAPRDDAYVPDKAAENVKAILAENDSFLVYGAVGTKIMADMTTLLKDKEADNWMQWGNHTGAQSHRDWPAGRNVFNVRPSYRMEAKALVDSLASLGYKKIGVYHQDDAYGRSGLDGVKRALQPMGLDVVGTATHPVGQKFDVSTAEQVKALRTAGAEAVVCIVGYPAGAGFVRDARETGWNVPIANFSPVSDTFLRTLVAYEAKNKKTITNHLMHSQVTPALDSDYPAVVEYRTLMDKRNPQPPQELQDANYRTNRYGFSSLEGFLAAKALVETLQRTGPELSRAKFRDAAEKMRDYDPGVGATLSWTSDSHEGLNRVWLLGVKNGAFTAMDDVKRFIPGRDGKLAVDAPKGGASAAAPANK